MQDRGRLGAAWALAVLGQLTGREAAWGAPGSSLPGGLQTGAQLGQLSPPGLRSVGDVHVQLCQARRAGNQRRL
jgi:hypothetical protein